MSKKKNVLPEDQRTNLIDLLNRRLADAIDVQLQSRQAYWNVKGPHFMTLRELLDKVARGVEEYTNMIDDHVMQIGLYSRKRHTRSPGVPRSTSTSFRRQMETTTSMPLPRHWPPSANICATPANRRLSFRTPILLTSSRRSPEASTNGAGSSRRASNQTIEWGEISFNPWYNAVQGH